LRAALKTYYTNKLFMKITNRNYPQTATNQFMNKYFTKLLVALLFVLGTVGANAQNVTVSGALVGTEHMPLLLLPSRLLTAEHKRVLPL
jgi:cytosine/uracil/thiamine/allantoin permease